MKLDNRKFAVTLGTAIFMAMVIVVSLTSVPKIPSPAKPGDRAGAIILASATSSPQFVSQSSLQSRAHSGPALAKAALPRSIPVPCPIWILGQLAGYGKTASLSADGAASGPNLVPAGIWFMQKFGEAYRKTL